MKILVVDNDQTILEFMHDLLSKEGHEVVTAKDGLSAFDVLEAHTPDVVFFDLVMPNIDGRKLCKIIRAMDKVKDAYLVVVSAITAEEKLNIAEMGADACVTKKSFDEMAPQILAVIDQSFEVSSLALPEETVGVKGMHPRRVTEELLAVKRHFEVILERMREGIVEVTDEGRVVYANPTALSLVNIPEEKLLASNFVDVFAERDRQQVVRLLSKKKSKPEATEDRVMVDLHGHLVLLDIMPIDGDSPSVLVILNDLTKIKQSEEALKKAHDELEERVKKRTLELSRANKSLRQEILERKQAVKLLRESEEKYRRLIENANDAIFIVQDEVVKFPNPKTEEMIGYSAEELAKMEFADLIHPEDRGMVLEKQTSRLEGEELPSTYSFRVIDKVGEVLWAELNTVLISWEGRPATLNFIRDITEKKRLEAQVQQAQRIQAIGTLAGGVAHDFNNLLMGIQANASLVLLDFDPSHPHHKRLKNIEQYVQNGSELTKQLLGFARGGKYEAKPTDLNESIKKSSEMFGPTKKEIAIQLKCQESIWAVEVDRGQMEQVLLNLYVNAWQAMPGGGTLYIQTENTTIDEDYVKPYQVEPGNYVKISITDTGVGMDEATRQRIFEPFFTTKEMGRGSGLGLASVYGIIKNHGGFINAYSEEGEGTTFNIYLPASKKGVTEDKGESEEVLKGGETVLLVDDEEMITEAGAQLLEEMGYRVLIAKSGKEAINIYGKSKDQIDMVILDMIMPGMGGGKTYDRLKKANPDVKVLLSSGYSISGEATEILKRGCNGFIQKPFHTKDLSRKIREILDKK